MQATPQGGTDGPQQPLVYIIRGAYSYSLFLLFLVPGIWLLLTNCYFVVSHPRSHNLACSLALWLSDWVRQVSESLFNLVHTF